jgi:hypothetical protein
MRWFLEGKGMVGVGAVAGQRYTDRYGNRYSEPLQTVYKYETVTIRPATDDDLPYRAADSFAILLPSEAKARELAIWYKL